ATGTIPLYLRSQSGNRVSNSINQSHRLFAGIEGETHGWDINKWHEIRFIFNGYKTLGI
ncbi:hypothetical protein IAF32_13430, partial [Acinetobacter baumannii]|nr:hypothetical protein [Acinetobacter baumannii]